jgi:uncharacterized protein involved in tolerance to divalent cations
MTPSSLWQTAEKWQWQKLEWFRPRRLGLASCPLRTIPVLLITFSLNDQRNNRMLRLSLNINNNTAPTYQSPHHSSNHDRQCNSPAVAKQQQQQHPSKHEEDCPSCLTQKPKPTTTYWWDDETETNSEEESLVIAITRGIENFREQSGQHQPDGLRKVTLIRRLSRSHCFSSDQMEETNHDDADACEDDDGINLIVSSRISSTVRFNELVRVSEFEPIDAMYHPLLYYTKGEIQRMRDVYVRECAATANQENTPPPDCNTSQHGDNDDDSYT